MLSEMKRYSATPAPLGTFTHYAMNAEATSITVTCLPRDTPFRLFGRVRLGKVTCGACDFRDGYESRSSNIGSELLPQTAEESGIVHEAGQHRKLKSLSAYPLSEN